jgi:hypothetical protein
MIHGLTLPRAVQLSSSRPTAIHHLERHDP